MGEIRQQTIHGMKWTAIEKFSIQGVNFILGIIVARLLTPADYGLIGMLGIFFAISQTLIDSGFSNALIRKLDCTEKDYCTVFYFNIVISLLCAAALFFGSPLIAKFFNQPVLAQITRVYCVNLFLGSLCGVQYAKLTKDINFKSQAQVNFISAISSGLIGLLLAWLGYGVWALVWQSIIANIVRTVSMFAIVKWWPRYFFSKASFRELFGYGSKLMASGLLHTLYSELTTIFIGKFYTPQALGNYSRGTALASMPAGIFGGIVQRVTFPIFSRIQNDDDKLIAVYRKYVVLTSMFIFFATILLASFARPIIMILLGEKWSGAIVFLQIYCFAIIFDPICYLNLNLLQIKGRSDLFLRLEIIKKLISFVILCLAVPFGVIAICVSKIIYTQIAVIINTYYTGKLFGLGYMKQMRDFMPYLLISLLSCVPALFLTLLCPWNIATIIIGSVISFGLYLYILYLKKDTYYKEFVSPYVSIVYNKIYILLFSKKCKRE